MKDPAILIKNRNQLIEDQREKYGYIFCQECQSSKAYKFHVHHIVFRSERPGHKDLHSKENLIIVCNRCHDDFHNQKSKRNYLLVARNLLEKFKISLI